MSDITWNNLNYNTFLLRKLIGLLSDDSTTLVAITKLKTLAKLFANKSGNDGKFEDEGELEEQWIQLLGLVLGNQLPLSLRSSSKHIVELRVCIIQIGSYVMCNTRKHLTDGRFFLNIMALCLDTIKFVKSCRDQEGFFEETAILMTVAEHCCSKFDFDDLSPQLHDLYTQMSSVLFVYRVLILYEKGSYESILSLLKNTKEHPVELDIEQSQSLASVSFNVGLKNFDAQQFESALIWLKFAYTYGKRISESNGKSECTENALTLLAACHLRIDGPKNWWQVIDILDYAERSSVNLELRLLAMLFAEKESELIAQCASAYFAIKLREATDGSSMREAANKLFILLEEKQKHSVLSEVLRHIPWLNLTTNNLLEDWPPLVHIRWICAKFALRCYSINDEVDCIFNLLVRLSEWDDGEDESNIEETKEVVCEIITTAEDIAVRFHNDKSDVQTTLQWYEILVKMATRHGVSCNVTWNAIRCCLATEYPARLDKAQKLLSLIPPEVDSGDFDHLCIRLQIAILERNIEKALQLIIQIDNSGSSSTGLKTLHHILALSIFDIVESVSSDFLFDCLRQLMDKCTQNSFKALILLFILRLQMETVRNNYMEDNKLREESLADLLLTVKDAYHYLENTNHQEDDCFRNEIITWFGRTSWNLGRQARQTAYYRHHFFKFSYKYFLLLTNADSCLQEEIETAMLVALESGLDFGKDRTKNRIPYIRILQSNVETASDFYNFIPKSKRSALVNLFEFHSLCEMKKWDRVEQLFHNYLVYYEENDRDATFFHSLASIICRVKDEHVYFDVQAPNTQIFTMKKRKFSSQRLCLTSMALNSLRLAAKLSVHLQLQFVLSWRWLINVLFDNNQWRDSLLRSRQEILDELRFALRMTDHSFADIRWLFAKIWNSCLMLNSQEDKVVITRWLVQSMESSSHSSKLAHIFKRQFDELLTGSSNCR